jgi:hypothetical protein
MQEEDAARRLAILRGEEPAPLSVEDEKPVDPAAGALVKGSGRDRATGERRKRKRAGEDDTDFEMRVARERAAQVAGGEEGSRGLQELVGFLEPEEQKELFKLDEGKNVPGFKKRTVGEQLANPGLKDVLGIKEDPWFVKSVKPGQVAEEPGRNAWGREDPGRKERDAARLDKNDPLAMMKRGAAKVREITQERKREMAERERELEMMRKEERRREKRRKREGGGRDEVEDLEGFSLDAPARLDDRSQTEKRSSTRREDDKPRDDRRRRLDEDRHHRSGRTGRDRHKQHHRHRSREGRGSER